MKRTTTARGYVLDCEHTVWYRIPPEPGMPLYCMRCQEYRTLPELSEANATYYPDGDFYAYKKGRVARGVCAKDGCDTEMTGPLPRVRTFFEKHERRACKVIETDVMINVVDLPPNSPPPF